MLVERDGFRRVGAFSTALENPRESIDSHVGRTHNRSSLQGEQPLVDRTM